MKRLIFVYTFVLFCFGVNAQSYEGFTLEESREIHKAFDYPISTWASGGDLTRYVFLNMYEFWEHALIHKKGEVRRLEKELHGDLAEANIHTSYGETTLKDYIAQSPTDGIIILSKGKIIYEEYPRMFTHDNHIYWSISKTFVSTIIGILEDRNQIDVEQPIAFYLNELKGSAWEEVKVIDILDMASGIDCREHEEDAFSDPNTCFYQYFQAIGFPSDEGALENPMNVFKSMKKLREPGEVFEYSSVNTTILTFLIERVTHKRYKDVLEAEIWQKIGAEEDAFILSTPSGQAASFGGISSNLRDLARYGLLFTPTGRQGKYKIISDEYLNKIQNKGRYELANASIYRDQDAEEKWNNTYQWDRVMEDGDFFKDGFGGQGLYISPKRDLVIAYFGSQDETGKINELEHIVRQLVLAGLFD
jgi:CubicO group peptidase (beta-lactamase class C family)